jgi:hypothetical protein
MMIRTTAKSVYYPISGQRAEVIRGSARVRYVRGSLLVNAKYFLTDKRLNDRGPVYAAHADPFLSRSKPKYANRPGWHGFEELQSEDASPSLVEAH